MATKLQIRNDSYENWSSVNPILLLGEIGYDITNKKIKIGDGLNGWNNLEYFKGEIYDDTLIKSELSNINIELETKANKDDVYTKEEIEELNYIDEDELISKNYMEKSEALEKFNTKEEISSMINNCVPISRTINNKALDTNIVLTASDVQALPSSTSIPSKTSDLENDSGYLSSIPSEYITESELNAKNYLTMDEANGQYATKAQGNKADTAVQPSVLSEYATTEAVSSTYATKSELASKADTSALSSYATTEAMNSALANKADTSALPSADVLMKGTAPTVQDIDGGSVTEIATLIESLNAILGQLRTRGIIA